MMKSFGAKTLIYPTLVWCVGSYGQMIVIFQT